MSLTNTRIVAFLLLFSSFTVSAAHALTMQEAIETCGTSASAYIQTVTRQAGFSEVIGSYLSSSKAAVIRPSKLHGNGLFAQEDLKVGDIVSMSGVETMINEAGIDPSWRFFKDGASSSSEELELKDDLSEQDLQELCKLYHQTALERTNVRTVVGFAGFVGLEVIKPIKKGEELLRGYMFGHWLRVWTVNSLLQEKEIVDVLWSYITKHQSETTQFAIAKGVPALEFLLAFSKAFKGNSNDEL